MTTEPNKYINDFRNLIPYYNLIFKLMEDVAKYSFERDILKLSRSIRELIINVAPYMKKPKDKLDQIEKELAKVLTKEFFNPNKTKEQSLEIEKRIDDYLKFIYSLRIDIHEDLTNAGLLPRNFIDDDRPAIVKYSTNLRR